jgi:membrane protein DedA with SNARE-associated domain
MLHQFIVWIVDVVRAWGYPGIFILMFLESTFIPVPSELVLIPAGYLVSQSEMNVFIVITMGTLGNIGGAIFCYYLALWLGRPILLRYGKYFLFKPETFFKAERFFNRHGEISTFTGRLILGVRHFISFPPGLARMKMSHFVLYTAAGSCIWDTTLTLIGWVAGNNQEMIGKYSHQATIGVVVFCVLLVSAYVWRHRSKAARAAQAAAVNPVE